MFKIKSLTQGARNRILQAIVAVSVSHPNNVPRVELDSTSVCNIACSIFRQLTQFQFPQSVQYCVHAASVAPYFTALKSIATMQFLLSVFLLAANTSTQ